MMKLTTFLESLHGVRGRLTSKRIKKGEILAPEHMADLYRQAGALGPVTLVGPDAAVAILAAYRDGRLPLIPGTKIQDAPRIDAYIADAEKHRPAAELRRRKAEKAKRPNEYSDEDLSDWHLLEAAFYHQIEDEPGTLTIGGRQVERRQPERVQRFRADEITFHWFDDERVEHVVRYQMISPTVRLPKAA